MLEITGAALAQFDKFFADKNVSPIRIYLAAGG